MSEGTRLSLTIGRKLALQALVPAASLGAILLIVFLSLGSLRETADGIGTDSFRSLVLSAELVGLEKDQVALVSKAPSELDLEKVGALQAEFDAKSKAMEAAVSDYESKGASEEMSARVGAVKGRLAAFRSSSAAVFKSASVFAQDSALEALNGPVAEAEANLRAALAEVARTARVSAAARVEAIDSQAAALRLSLSALCLGLLAATGLVAWRVGDSIVRPLSALREDVSSIAAGSIGSSVRGTGRGDEIGPLAQAVEGWRLGLQAERERALAHAEAEAAKLARAEALESATRRFDAEIGRMMAQVSETTHALSQAAEALKSAAEEGEVQSTAVAAAAEQATSNVETVAAAGTELSASICEISGQVHQTAERTRTATEEVGRATSMMEGLSDSVSEIGAVVGIINDIAANTNLLALNATIEAARAGEAGKGFAVVANEVKNLSRLSSRNAEDIIKRIQSIRDGAKTAAQAMDGVSKAVSGIEERSASIASAVEEQSAATDEIGRNVVEAATGTRDVSEGIVRVARASKETGSKACVVFKAVEALRAGNSALEVEIESFLREVRA